MAQKKQDPLDHDGDGRKGGSLPKEQRQAADAAPASDGEAGLFTPEQEAEIRRLAADEVRRSVSRRSLR